jgi:hypothetical protein
MNGRSSDRYVMLCYVMLCYVCVFYAEPFQGNLIKLN